MTELRANRLPIAGRLLLLSLVTISLLLAGQIDRDAAYISILVDRSNGVSGEATDDARRELGAALQDRMSDSFVSTDTMKLPALFDQTLRRLDPSARNGIVIASSGYWPADMQVLLEQSASAGIPVSWVPVPVADPRPRITSIESPARARVGERISITVRTTATDPGNYRVLVFVNSEPAGQQPLVSDASASVQVDVAATGVLQIDAELLDDVSGRPLDRLQGGALINVVSTPRLLVLTDGNSPFANSLAAGGWPVTQMTPREFQARSSTISIYSAIILDDVSADALPEGAWQQVAEAVKRDATGLLVLGGPQSFGLGGYRGSTLEQLLPVVSEPPANEPPVSVIFLVDISGSMARPTAAANKLRAANAAVLHTATALRPQDRVGMIGFDVEAQQLLGVAAREDHAAAIRQAWPADASGGTSVVPALDLAQAALAEETSEQKLLFLVTDGMLSDEDIGSLEARLAADDFELTAMVMRDESDDAPISRLALGDRGSILIVDDVMRLPVLMRDELEDRRPALEKTRTLPSVAAALPAALPAAAWPAVDAYLLTRPRPGATVMLAADRQEPLLAGWTVGAGRVVALTSGLNQWATDWLSWERWPELAAGLVNHVAVRNEGTVRTDREGSPPGREALLIESGPRDVAEKATAQLVMPNGSPQSVPLIPEAPGIYKADIETEPGGRYTLVWDDAGGLRRHSFLGGRGRNADRSVPPFARQLVEMGLLQEWSDDWAEDLSGNLPVKKMLVAIALFGLLVVVAAERVPASQFRQLLLAGRRRLQIDRA